MYLCTNEGAHSLKLLQYVWKLVIKLTRHNVVRFCLPLMPWLS